MALYKGSKPKENRGRVLSLCGLCYKFQKMDSKWDPKNKSDYLKGVEDNEWSHCPDEHLAQLKKQFDKKRFGLREACKYTFKFERTLSHPQLL